MADNGEPHEVVTLMVREIGPVVVRGSLGFMSRLTMQEFTADQCVPVQDEDPAGGFVMCRDIIAVFVGDITEPEPGVVGHISNRPDEESTVDRESDARMWTRDDKPSAVREVPAVLDKNGHRWVNSDHGIWTRSRMVKGEMTSLRPIVRASAELLHDYGPLTEDLAYPKDQP